MTDCELSIALSKIDFLPEKGSHSKKILWMKDTRSKLESH